MFRTKWLQILHFLSGGEPFFELLERHEVLIRSARRCAYDLDHAASMIGSENRIIRTNMMRKAEHWKNLFASGNAMKDYVHRLHAEIERLEDLNRRHVSVIMNYESGDYDPNDDTQIPF